MIRVAPDGTLSVSTSAQVLVEPVLVNHPVELRYSASDPFAVRLCFHSPRAVGSTASGRRSEGLVVWRLDRGALSSGHAVDEAFGDVRVTRLDTLGLVMIELAPSTLAARVTRFAAKAVDEFLAATYQAVPRGSETLDIDRLVGQLLGRC